MRLPETAEIAAINAAYDAMCDCLTDDFDSAATVGLAAVRAFCESMGFEEEFDREGMDDLVIRNKPDRIRLVSRWRPVEGTDGDKSLKRPAPKPIWPVEGEGDA